MDSRMQPAIARRPNRTQPDQVGVPAAGSTFNGARFAGSMGAAPADRPAAPKRAASTGRQSSGGDVTRDGEEFRGAGYPPTRAPGPGVGPVDKGDSLRVRRCPQSLRTERVKAERARPVRSGFKVTRAGQGSTDHGPLDGRHLDKMSLG